MSVYERTERLIGEEALDKLKKSKVIVFGVGGVGSFVVEALARAGIGEITVVDKDVVDESNINRQLVALQSTVGKSKVEVAADRIKDINPDIIVTPIQECYTQENADDFDFSEYDFIVDAIDMVPSKLTLIEKAKESGTPIIASMGMGNKLHPEMIKLADISKTEMDPLAKKIRTELRKRRIKKVPVVYSTEQPKARLTPPGSISTVPSSAGLMIASYIINSIVEE